MDKANSKMRTKEEWAFIVWCRMLGKFYLANPLCDYGCMDELEKEIEVLKGNLSEEDLNWYCKDCGTTYLTCNDIYYPGVKPEWVKWD